MPELLRVRGELRARSGDHPGAEQDLHAAMDLAEQQSALSWSLRVAASRARLAIEPKTKADAVSDLKRIYARFGEGFETPISAMSAKSFRSIWIARPDRVPPRDSGPAQLLFRAAGHCRRSQQLTAPNNP